MDNLDNLMAMPIDAEMTSEADPIERLPARARDRKRAALAELLGEDDAHLDPETIPRFTTPAERSWWLAELLVQGLWRTEHTKTIAAVWGLSPFTVREDAKFAARMVLMLDGDIEKLSKLSALRIAKLSQLAEDERVQLEAHKLILQLTGHLKGGRDYDGLTEQQREEQMIAALRDPDPTMERWLRAAMSEPGEVLRGLLGEFGAVMVEGEER